jgi:hypothetical protein
MMLTRHSQQGSTLVMALTSLSVLAFAAAGVFYFIANRYETAFQSSSWDEALVVAESGVDTAMQAFNQSSDPNSWTGWTYSASSTKYPYPHWTYGTATSPGNTISPHTGDGNNKMFVSITVDKQITDSNGTVWPRITSSGTTEVPGLPRVGYAPAILSLTGVKNHKNMLRHIAMKGDVTNGNLHVPQVTRTVQVVAKPQTSSLFQRAVEVQNSMTMSGGAYTDSFNSQDPTKSTNGQYDPLKRQSHGDIASNTTGGTSDLMNSTVYGNASSNGGAIQNTAGVKGSVYNNFSTTIAAVSNPSFSSVNLLPTQVKNPGGPVTLTAGTASTPQNYVLSELTVSNGSNPLILASPTPGQESYINIWVTGDLTTSGSGYIQQQPGVHATFWVNGKVTVSGSAFDNQNGYASYLTINGVTPANGATNTYTISGSANFVGVINAPSYALTLSGSGDLMGAFIMYSMNISGAAGFHYDESLAGNSGGSNLGFVVASWIEDLSQ